MGPTAQYAENKFPLLQRPIYLNIPVGKQLNNSSLLLALFGLKELMRKYLGHS